MSEKLAANAGPNRTPATESFTGKFGQKVTAFGFLSDTIKSGYRLNAELRGEVNRAIQQMSASEVALVRSSIANGFYGPTDNIQQEIDQLLSKV